jgi:hypothetical protein
MASPNIYPAGLNLAGTVFAGGPSVAQLYPSYISGLVQWVDTISGNNSNAGSEPELPVATLAQAFTNSAANGMIVIGAGSHETVTSQITSSLAGVTVWGCGSGSSRPRYTSNTSGSPMISVSGAGLRFRNLYFPASASVDGARLTFTGINCKVRDCYLEFGASDTTAGGAGIAVGAGSSGLSVEGTYFVVTASRPSVAFSSAAASITDVALRDCVFDGGSYGWTDYAFKVLTNAVSRLYLENVSFLHRSDLGISITGCTYQMFGVTNDGTSRVVIAA